MLVVVMDVDDDEGGEVHTKTCVLFWTWSIILSFFQIQLDGNRLRSQNLFEKIQDNGWC